MDYRQLNDYELAYQVNENNEEAYNMVFMKYSPLISSLASSYYYKNRNIGLDFDDFYQEGMLAISTALRNYDGRNSLLYTYIMIYAKREMERIIKGQRRNKHAILNNAYSLNKNVRNDSDAMLEDLIPSNYDLEEQFIGDQYYEKIMDFKYKLKFEEACIFELKSNDFTIKEIAVLLDIPYKKVDNTLRKVKIMLRKYILTL